MSENFKIGDVVQLKSGGEKMTIEEIYEKYATCVWFEGKKIQRHEFVMDTLKKFERPAVGATSVR